MDGLNDPPEDAPAPLALDLEAAPHVQELFRSLAARAPIGIGLLDRSLRYLYVTPHLAALNGMPAETHLGRTVEEVIPALAPALLPVLRGVLATGEPALNAEFAGRATADSADRRWLAQYYPIRNVRGDVDGIAGLVVDVSEAHQVHEALHRSEQDLASALEAAGMGIWTWDLAADAVTWSDDCGRLFGLKPDEFDGTLEAFYALVHPDDRDPMNAALGRARDSRSEYRCEYRVVQPDGGVRWVETKGRFEYDAAGTARFMRAVTLDIQERKRLEAALRDREEELRLAMEAGQTGTWAWDVRTGQITWSPFMERLHGFAPGTFDGSFEAVAARTHPEDRRSQADILRASERWQQVPYQKEYRVLWPDGSVHWIKIEGRMVTDERGEPLRLRGTGTDVTERRQAQEDLLHRATHDPLTGLPNRTLFLDRTAQAVAHAQRRGGTLAVLFLDLDRFKHINDTLGHAAGDALLREAARRLNAVLRAEDTLARMSGDEFTLLLRGPVGWEDAARIAHRALDALAAPFLVADHELFVTASVGVSLYPHDGHDATVLLRHADIAMYQAKEAGPSTCRLYTEDMSAAALERLALESSLRKAIEQPGSGHGEMTLFFQPLVAAGGGGREEAGQIVGAEALVRWRHPDRGLIPPAQFIPLAEETGLIVPLGEWVLRAACRQAAQWQSEGRSLRVSVNLSARQFRQPDLAAQVGAALADAGLGPERLTLELTESALMTTGEGALSALHALRALGVAVAVDDFGTGYSSLAYLRHLPLDVLKIDRAFVQDLEAGGKDQVLVWAIIAMAHGLELSVVAEGVETPEQRDILAGMHCDYLQGFLFSLPLPPDRLML